MFDMDRANRGVPDTRKPVTAREVDAGLWRRFRARIELNGLTTGHALNSAIALWLDSYAAKPDDTSTYRAVQQGDWLTIERIGHESVLIPVHTLQYLLSQLPAGRREPAT